MWRIFSNTGNIKLLMKIFTARHRTASYSKYECNFKFIFCWFKTLRTSHAWSLTKFNMNRLTRNCYYYKRNHLHQKSSSPIEPKYGSNNRASTIKQTFPPIRDNLKVI